MDRVRITGYIKRLRDAQRYRESLRLEHGIEERESENMISSEPIDPEATEHISSSREADSAMVPDGCQVGISKADLEFLFSHGIPVSEVFDCGGGSVRHFKTVMEKLGKTIAINATPCYAHGHRIRTRANHCIQCNTRNYGFQKQYLSGGWIYIASSHSQHVQKIGLTKHPEERDDRLNVTGYGGIIDWKIQYCLQVKIRAGELECQVHKALSEYRVYRSYHFCGVDVACQEIFNCGYEIARRVLEDSAQSFDIMDKRESS